jgi:hypothetical protein
VALTKVGLQTAGLVTAAALWAAGPIAAQTRPSSPANGAQIQARHEISALEGVLENAVNYGAQMLTQHVQTSNIPDMVMLTGMSRARGFRLDGYGVLFDVEFPSIRRSVMWSMRALQRPDRQLLDAMREMRKNMQGPGDAGARQALDRDIKEIEAQIKASEGPMTAASTSSNAVGGPTVTPNSTADPKSDLKDLYFTEITNALIDAILDHGAPVAVGADEWVTVAARESADRGFMPSDPNDTAMTFILRIKGADLQALRERRLTKEEARKKVELKKY